MGALEKCKPMMIFVLHFYGQFCRSGCIYVRVYHISISTCLNKLIFSVFDLIDIVQFFYMQQSRIHKMFYTLLDTILKFKCICSMRELFSVANLQLLYQKVLEHSYRCKVLTNTGEIILSDRKAVQFTCSVQA